jgi:hypothetical protein
MKKIICILTIFTLGILGAVAQTNLISNPGFETMEDNLPADWIFQEANGVTYESAENTVREGSKSLKISSTEYVWSEASQYIEVVPGKKYNLSAWFNVEDFEEEYGSFALLGFIFTDIDGVTIGAGGGDPSYNGDMTKDTWRKLEVQTREAPANAAYLKVRLYTNYHIVVYFDDVSVTEEGAVTKQDQSISGLSDISKTADDADFELAAVASSGLPVSYSSSNEAVATVSGSTVHIVAAGETNITASQAGNDEYNAAPDVTVRLTVSAGSGIDEVQMQLPVRVVGGRLIINALSGLRVDVYNAQGIKLQSQIAVSDETVFNGLPSGRVLIVRSGKSAAKVIL